MLDYITDQVATEIKPAIDEGKKLLDDNKGLVTSLYRLRELPEEARRKICSYILNSREKESAENISLGVKLISDGDLNPRDLPSLGEMIGEQLWKGDGWFYALTSGMEKVLYEDEKEIDQNMRNILTEKLLLGINASVDAGHLERDVEDLFMLIKTKIKPSGEEILNRQKNIQNYYDIERANYISTQPDEKYNVKSLFEKNAKEYPRVAQAVSDNILEKLNEDEVEDSGLIEEVGWTRYEEYGIAGRMLIEKLLGKNADYAEEFLNLFANGLEGVIEPSNLEKLIKIAEETVVGNDKLIKKDKQSGIFNEIKMEALVYDPDFSFVDGSWDKGDLKFASNGLVVTETVVSSGFPISDAETWDKLRKTIGNIGEENSFFVDFIPYDRPYFIDSKKLEVMKMGVVGIKKFIEYCNQVHIPNDVLIIGDTNLRLVKMLLKLGFVSLDFETNNDPDEQIDIKEARVFSTVGRIKEAMKHPFVTRILEKVY